METPVSSAPVLHLTSASFNSVILSAEKAVVDFWAEWCGPCQRFAPVFEELSAGYPDVQFCKCNTDENPGIAQEFCIYSIPTVLFIKKGKVVHIESGAMSAEEFRRVLADVFQ
ncbi:MAG TPA: thioredoxin [Methanocorpusculum sp.]|nr:thioredoxin [Methanocorpusculum sp.]